MGKSSWLTMGEILTTLLRFQSQNVYTSSDLANSGTVCIACYGFWRSFLVF